MKKGVELVRMGKEEAVIIDLYEMKGNHHIGTKKTLLFKSNEQEID